MAGIRVTFDDSALLAKLQVLEGKLLAAVRPAVAVAAKVIYDEVRLNAPISEKAHSTRGKKQTYQPGNLQDSIYRVYSKTGSTETYAKYQIGYNVKKAFYTRFVEYGTVRSPAYPFIRPAYDAKKEAALQAAKSKFLELAKGAINGA